MPATAKNPGTPRALVVPRAWLVALTVLAVVPWLVVAAVYLRRGAEAAVEPPTAAAAATSSAAPDGRWGRLTVVPIVISPPVEFVSSDWGNWTEDADQWFFPGAPAGAVGAFLASSGLSHADVSQLLATATPHPATRGLVITPDPGLVQRLDKDVRGRIYAQLARSQLNLDQANSLLNFFNDTPEPRFLELDAALDTLRKDYFVVENGFELGDVVAFVDRDGDQYHVAVHLRLVYHRRRGL